MKSVVLQNFKLMSDINSFYDIFMNKIKLITNSSENEVVRNDDWLEELCCRRILSVRRNFYDDRNFYEYRNFDHENYVNKNL